MLAVNQDKVEKPIGHMLQDLGGAFLVPLIFFGRRLGIYRAVCWLQDERRRTALINELNRLDDHYLRDVGIERCDIDTIADTMVRRLRESRKHS